MHFYTHTHEQVREKYQRTMIADHMVTILCLGELGKDFGKAFVELRLL